MVVSCTLEIISLGVDGAGKLHIRIEAELRDGDPVWVEDIPEVSHVLAEVLGSEVGVGVTLVPIEPAIGLDVGSDDACRVMGVGGVGGAGSDTVGRGVGELGGIGVD